MYDITMTSALADINYMVLATAGFQASDQTPGAIMALHSASNTGNELAPTTTVFRISAVSYTGGAIDFKYVSVGVFR